MRGPDISVLIIMGVSGSGKSTVGAALAKRLDFVFQDGDAFHPKANLQKMAAGIALTDDDRAPWLQAINAELDRRIDSHEPVVIACSALKRAYRANLLSTRANTRLVYLRVPHAVLANRLSHRGGHFMPASLLGSQLDALEPPTPDERAICVDADLPVDAIIAEIIEAL